MTEHLGAEVVGVGVVAERPAGAGADQRREERVGDGEGEEEAGSAEAECGDPVGEHRRRAEEDVQRPGILHSERVDLHRARVGGEAGRIGNDVEQPGQAEGERRDVRDEEDSGELHRDSPRTSGCPRQEWTRRMALNSTPSATGRSHTGDNQ